MSCLTRFESANNSLHILEMLDTVAEKLQSIEDAEFIDKDGKDVSINQYDIEFKDVSFGYDSREVLSHISFRIPQNTTTAIVGPSGSGGKPQSAVYWLGFMMHGMEKYKWEATMFGNLPAILY